MTPRETLLRFARPRKRGREPAKLNYVLTSPWPPALRDEHASEAGLEREILAACRARLPAHMTPARLRFVADLPITGAGKLVRHG
jgi:acyl-CoA synthetase (AMP-forming)/AMP-acid ligase II